MLSSAGRGGSSPNFSTSGLKPAKAARVATAVWRRLCLFTLSPRSLKRSAVPSTELGLNMLKSCHHASLDPKQQKITPQLTHPRTIQGHPKSRNHGRSAV